MYRELYEAYANEYQKNLESIENNVVNTIKHAVPDNNGLVIGNMVYGWVVYEDKEVPAYCYRSDFKASGKDFKKVANPIWDRHRTGGFGWADFATCCRIYDAIQRHVG